MQKFQQENLEHIQEIFSQKTGVYFPAQKKPQIRLRKAVVLAAALLCFLMVTGFAVVKFSSLKGDEVQLQGGDMKGTALFLCGWKMNQTESFLSSQTCGSYSIKRVWKFRKKTADRLSFIIQTSPLILRVL